MTKGQECQVVTSLLKLKGQNGQGFSFTGLLKLKGQDCQGFVTSLLKLKSQDEINSVIDKNMITRIHIETTALLTICTVLLFTTCD